MTANLTERCVTDAPYTALRVRVGCFRDVTASVEACDAA